MIDLDDIIDRHVDKAPKTLCHHCGSRTRVVDTAPIYECVGCECQFDAFANCEPGPKARCLFFVKSSMVEMFEKRKQICRST